MQDFVRKGSTEGYDMKNVFHRGNVSFHTAPDTSWAISARIQSKTVPPMVKD